MLIKVHATSVNRADLLQRTGKYPPPAGSSDIMGLECSGTILTLGADVRGPWKVGDRCCALLTGGGYAEIVSCPAECLLPVPEGVSLTDAAGLPEVFITAYLNMYLEGRLAKGKEAVLVHAGASGVGTAAIQLAKAFGNPCYVTVSGPAKVKACAELGATAAIDRKAEGGWAAELARLRPGGVGVVVDCVGADYFADNVEVLSPRGRLVLIGTLSGATASNVPLNRIMAKRLEVIGSVLRSRSVQEKARIIQMVIEDVWPLIASGAVRPITHTVLPLLDAEACHKIVKQGDNIGKVIMTISAPNNLAKGLMAQLTPKKSPVSPVSPAKTQ